MFGAWLENVPLVVSLLAVLLAQVVKIPLHYLYHRKWDWSRLAGAGGMPSSHSAGVTALAVSVGSRDGIGSTAFAVSCVLGLIVMYDAMGIRRHAGEQAMAINELEAAFDQHMETDDPEFSQRKLRHKRKRLKELLGHQPIEVAGGASFGIAIGITLSLVMS